MEIPMSFFTPPPTPTIEPTMEDILASIRRILSEDEAEDVPASPSPTTTALSSNTAAPSSCVSAPPSGTAPQGCARGWEDEEILMREWAAMAGGGPPRSAHERLEDAMEDAMEEAMAAAEKASRKKASAAGEAAAKRRSADAAMEGLDSDEPSMDDILASIRRILSDDEDPPSSHELLERKMQEKDKREERERERARRAAALPAACVSPSRLRPAAAPSVAARDSTRVLNQDEIDSLLGFDDPRSAADAAGERRARLSARKNAEKTEGDAPAPSSAVRSAAVEIAAFLMRTSALAVRFGILCAMGARHDGARWEERREEWILLAGREEDGLSRRWFLTDDEKADLSLLFCVGVPSDGRGDFEFSEAEDDEWVANLGRRVARGVAEAFCPDGKTMRRLVDVGVSCGASEVLPDPIASLDARAEALFGPGEDPLPWLARLAQRIGMSSHELLEALA